MCNGPKFEKTIPQKCLNLDAKKSDGRDIPFSSRISRTCENNNPFLEILTKCRSFSIGKSQVIVSLKFNLFGHLKLESFCFTPEFVEKVAQKHDYHDSANLVIYRKD